MAIKHLAAPLLAGGAVLGYAAWARFKRGRQLPLEHPPETVAAPSVESVLEEWASSSSPPDDSMSSTTLSHGLDEATSSSTLNHGLGLEGISSGVVAGTGLPESDEPSSNRISGSWSDDVSEAGATDDSASAITATTEEPRSESSPLVDFSAQSSEQREEDEQYETEGAMAPEDLGVRWLARATEAFSPYNASIRGREFQADWVEAGLVAEASARAADGGELLSEDDIEVLSEDFEPPSRSSEYQLNRP